MKLSWWLIGKELACQCRRLRFDPGSEGAHGEGPGNPLQYSCLGNPMDRGACWATQSMGSQRVRHHLEIKQQQHETLQYIYFSEFQIHPQKVRRVHSIQYAMEQCDVVYNIVSIVQNRIKWKWTSKSGGLGFRLCFCTFLVCNLGN